MVPHFGWQEFLRGGIIPLVLHWRWRCSCPNPCAISLRARKEDEIARTLAKIDKRLSFPPDTEFVLRPNRRRRLSVPSNCSRTAARRRLSCCGSRFCDARFAQYAEQLASRRTQPSG